MKADAKMRFWSWTVLCKTGDIDPSLAKGKTESHPRLNHSRAPGKMKISVLTGQLHKLGALAGQEWTLSQHLKLSHLHVP